MEKYDEQQLASHWNFKFKNAMVHKAEYTKRWQTYFDAYNGDYFKNDSLPDYRSNMVSNYIFAIIETIRPIMLDNDPKFQAMPRNPDGMQFSDDLQEALMYEWDREKVNRKLYKELINTLVTGNAVFFIPWNSKKKVVNAIAVNPFNIFQDPLATDVEDADYIIYASYKSAEFLQRMFPDKKDKLIGGDVNYSELVHDNDKNARVDNQILVLEVWTRGYEIEGSEVYPKGRLLHICPELGIVLSNKENPYKDGELPFVVLKDYDIPGKFWGEGEVSQLLSPQTYMNELNNAIIDSAKTTANMPWIVDKNSGIGVGKITSRPGLIIRKNPGTEVRREQPPQMPMYVTNAVETYKSDLEMISGVHNTLRGENSSGVYTAQGILALQEAGHVRIRLKVKLLEDSLANIAELWVSRMKQFWKDDKWVKVSSFDGGYDLKKFTKEALEYDYDIKITAGSTMPVNRGAMLDLMIRLAQTNMPDGQPIVDRESVVHYLPEEVKAPLLKRMSENNSSLQEIEDMVKELMGGFQELNQNIEQIVEDYSSADEEIIGIIEEVVVSVEDVKKQILQLSEEYDKMVTEGKEQEKLQKLQDDYYNKGYDDAESLYSTELQTNEEENMVGLDEIPEEILAGIGSMSDEELAEMLEMYPEITELFS